MLHAHYVKFDCNNTEAPKKKIFFVVVVEIEFIVKRDCDSFLMDNKEECHMEENRITETVPQRLPGKSASTPKMAQPWWGNGILK